MRFVFSVRLTSPILGQIQTPEIMKFWRDRTTDMIELDQAMWVWLWTTALEEVAAKDVYRGAVRMDRFLSPIQTVVYARRFRKGQVQKQCEHEAIRKGAIVTFGASIVTPDPSEPPTTQTLRRPEPEELAKALERIGNTLGISPFGSQFGYGRFNISTMEIDGRDCTPPAG